MALGQLLHVKIEVEPSKSRSRHQSVTGPDPPSRRRSDAQCSEGPSTSNENNTNSVMPPSRIENPIQCQVETDELICSSRRMFDLFIHSL